MKATVLAVLLAGCAGAEGAGRPATTDDDGRRFIEMQRAEQRANDDATRAHAEELRRAAEERRTREAQGRADREQAARDQTAAAAKAHADDCASTFRLRFLDIQAALRDYASMRAKFEARCREVAKHCTTISGGRSICHGITPAEQQAFDEICGVWPNYRPSVPVDDACADVDPEPLGFDFSWTLEQAAAFRKRTPPQ